MTNTPNKKIKLLMIDNYDSFTFNIVQYFGELGADVTVARNDEITVAEIDALLQAGQLGGQGVRAMGQLGGLGVAGQPVAGTGVHAGGEGSRVGGPDGLPAVSRCAGRVALNKAGRVACCRCCGWQDGSQCGHAWRDIPTIAYPAELIPNQA